MIIRVSNCYWAVLSINAAISFNLCIWEYNKISDKNFDLVNAKESRKFYVYVLADPESQAVFYVGKGIGSRAQDHIKQANKTGYEASEKLDEIRRLKELNYEDNAICHVIAHRFYLKKIKCILSNIFKYYPCLFKCKILFK